ncbi:hypothetical protein BJV78DRAFT_1140114, partial [Lactifluus subvellereus]
KRERQWTKWMNKTIPSLLQPYLHILHESDNLCHLNHHSDATLPASSCQRQASVNVTCVFFERLEVIQIHYCECFTAPLQLLQHRLFPCAPTAPTLAVDLKMLKFTCELFLGVALNNTTWCDL